MFTSLRKLVQSPPRHAVGGRFMSSSVNTVLYSWGIGTNGELGHAKFELQTTLFGEAYVQYQPRKMLKSKNFVQVAIGDGYTLGRTNDGHLFGWGKGLINFDGGEEQRNEPIPLVIDKNIKNIAAGPKHAAFVDEQGLVFTWGHGGSFFTGGGQLGHGSKEKEYKPRLVESLKEYGAKIVSVSCGLHHTLFLSDDGELLSCGVGEYGRTGAGHTTDLLIPHSIESVSNENITQISAGYDHSLALTESGKVLSWGRNHLGQLGHSDSYIDMYSMEDYPRPLDGDSLKSDEDSDGQIHFKYVSAGNGRSAAISRDGRVFLWGSRISHQPKPLDPVLFNNQRARKVACGGESNKSAIFVLTESDQLWVLGDSKSGMMGQEKHSGRHIEPAAMAAFANRRVLDVFAGVGEHAFARVVVDA